MCMLVQCWCKVLLPAGHQNTETMLPAQSKMIFLCTNILLLASLCSPVRWIKKLNSDIFQLDGDQEREGKSVEKEEGCGAGFFCMFIEDGGDDAVNKDSQDDEKFEFEKTEEVTERVEYDTSVCHNNI